MSQKDDKLEAARAAATETAQKAAATAAEIGSKVGEMASGLFGKLKRTVHEATEDNGQTEADRLIKTFVEANGADRRHGRWDDGRRLSVRGGQLQHGL